MILNERATGTSPHQFQLTYSSPVRPVRYKHRDLRQVIGNLIGSATEDDVLAAFLLQAEARAARTAYDEINEWFDLVTAEVRAREEQLLKADDYDPSLRWEAERLLRTTVSSYRLHLELLRQAKQAGDVAFTRLQATYGRVPHALLTDESARRAADAVMSSHSAAAEVWQQFCATRIQANQEASRLIAASRRREAFAASGAGCTPQELRSLDGTSLEHLAARLLTRDGLTLLRASGGPGDQGADLIAVAPDGRRFVIQTKYRQRGAINPRVVYELNGTARDLHDADIAVVCTNSTFSDQATRDAAKLGIHLIHGEQLSLWATWGDTIYEILRLDRRVTTTPTGEGQAADHGSSVVTVSSCCTTTDKARGPMLQPDK
ncbi:restriction endonuclease [Kitasatospora sp. NPDC101801]|uniref:restriction endonuclease n=1 Tax=Kitasatospora sp. NPDC101801 TaxID=3364103 RepID=UPI0037FCF1B0